MYVMCGFYNTMPLRSQGLIPKELNEKVQNRWQKACELMQEMIAENMLPQYLLDEAMEVVHKSNMTKLDDEGNVLRSDGTDGNPEGKILKGPNYVAPDMAPIVEKCNTFIDMMEQSGELQKIAEEDNA